MLCLPPRRVRPVRRTLTAVIAALVLAATPAISQTAAPAAAPATSVAEAARSAGAGDINAATLDAAHDATLEQQIDGAVANDQLGVSVSLSGDRALIGAFLADPGGRANAGSVYVYVRSGSTWTLEQRFDGTAAGDYFGYVVSLAGDRALIGAREASPNGRTNAGSAYVYVRSGSVWTLEHQFDGAAASDYFGTAVSLANDRALVGAYFASPGGRFRAGSAYVYVRSGSAWTLEQRFDGAAANDLLGGAVSLVDDRALISAAAASPGGRFRAGSAYVYVRSGSAWTLEQRLDGALANDGFASTVSLAGDRALIGAPAASPGGRGYAGSAYVYVREGSGWTLERQFDGTAASNFLGTAVSLVGDRALVGALGASPGGRSHAGSAYVYARSGSTWTLEQRFDGAASDDNFAYAVSLSSDHVLIGARLTDPGGRRDAGSAYLYAFPASTADEGGAQATFALSAARPNPARGAAALTLSLPEASAVRVAVVDVLGREVAVLAEGQQAAGDVTVRVPSGALAAGTYVVRATVGTHVLAQRLTVTR